MNSVINKTIIKNMSPENTIPFEINALKNLNYSNSDVLVIDLAELTDLNPVNISNNEKKMTAIFLDKLQVDIDSKVIIEITTTPHELAYFFLMTLRNIIQINRNP